MYVPMMCILGASGGRGLGFPRTDTTDGCEPAYRC